jgi:hypothetical protein
MENLTEKYEIKMKWRCCHLPDMARVSENYYEESEALVAELFEKYVFELKIKNKEKYNMIELGSNYSYYSMLFKKIIGPDKTFNLMVEPYGPCMQYGKDHFEINNLEGVFLQEQIRNPTPCGVWGDIPFDCPSTTIDELFERYNIDELDMLHCDIDTGEVYMLDEAENALKDKKIDTLFIMTHARNAEDESLCKCGKGPAPLHVEVRKRLLDYGYTLLFDHEPCTLSGDSMVIFKR